MIQTWFNTKTPKRRSPFPGYVCVSWRFKTLDSSCGQQLVNRPQTLALVFLCNSFENRRVPDTEGHVLDLDRFLIQHPTHPGHDLFKFLHMYISLKKKQQHDLQSLSM